MAVGTTDQLIIGYWTETAYGVSPAATTPLKLLRITSETLQTNRTLKESEEIIGTRNLQNLFLTDGEGVGDINAQLTYSDFDELIAAALGCAPAWTANVALNGNVLTTYTAEKKVADIAVPVFMPYPGVVVNTMKLMLKTGEFAKVTFGLKGKLGTAYTTTSMSSVAATSATTNPVMNCATDISLINEGGSGITLVNSLEIDTSNGIRFQRALASLGPQGATLGKFRLTGSVEAYFQDKSLLDKYMAGTVSSIATTIGGASTKKYAISIPKVIYTDAEVVAGGLDQDFVAKMKFTAYYDTGIVGTVQITRTP